MSRCQGPPGLPCFQHPQVSSRDKICRKITSRQGERCAAVGQEASTYACVDIYIHISMHTYVCMYIYIYRCVYVCVFRIQAHKKTFSNRRVVRISCIDTLEPLSTQLPQSSSSDKETQIRRHTNGQTLQSIKSGIYTAITTFQTYLSDIM